jgi:RNA polymerase subunit RPABC4/transcription elongation factor Spt4
MSKTKTKNCKTCNAEIASNAKVCPSCGAKIKKPIYKRIWVWAIAIIVIIAIASTTGGKKYPPSNYSADLDSGKYTVGIDFPAGNYDIEVISGGGNVSSSNGKINAIMGTADKNSVLGTDMYKQKYSNITLDGSAVLSISNVKVRNSCTEASGAPLKPRNQSITDTVTLENGNFTAGKDFKEGVYDISVVSGGGNVICSSNGLNMIMGAAEKNNLFGTNLDLYQQTYKNADFKKDAVLKVDGVKIQLTPSK